MSERLSRRRFLELSGAVTGGAVLAGVGRAARAVVPPEASILPETQVPQVPQVSQEGIKATQETPIRKEIEVHASLDKPTSVEGNDGNKHVFGLKTKDDGGHVLVRYDQDRPDEETEIIETDQYCASVNPESGEENASGIEILASIKAIDGKENVFWGEGVDPSLWFRIGRSGYFPKEMKLAFAEIEGENKKRRVFAAIKQYEENGERKVFLGVEGDALAARAEIKKTIMQKGKEQKSSNKPNTDKSEITVDGNNYSITIDRKTGKTFIDNKAENNQESIGFFVEQEIGVLYGAKKLEMLCHDSKIHLAIISDYSNSNTHYKEHEGWYTHAIIQKGNGGILIDYNKAAFAFGVYSGKRGKSHFVDQPHLFSVPGAVGISYITEKENGKYEFWLTIAVPGGSTKWQRKRREPEDQAKAKSPRISTKYIDDRGEIKEIEAASESNIEESFAQLGLETQNYYLFYDFLVKDGINRDDLTGSTELNGTPFVGRLTREGKLTIFREKKDGYRIITQQALSFANISSFEMTVDNNGNLWAVFMGMDNGQKKVAREKIIVREKTFFPTLFQAFLGLFSSA